MERSLLAAIVGLLLCVTGVTASWGRRLQDLPDQDALFTPSNPAEAIVPNPPAGTPAVTSANMPPAATAPAAGGAANATAGMPPTTVSAAPTPAAMAQAPLGAAEAPLGVAQAPFGVVEAPLGLAEAPLGLAQAPGPAFVGVVAGPAAAPGIAGDAAAPAAASGDRALPVGETGASTDETVSDTSTVTSMALETDSSVGKTFAAMTAVAVPLVFGVVFALV